LSTSVCRRARIFRLYQSRGEEDRAGARGTRIDRDRRSAAALFLVVGGVALAGTPAPPPLPAWRALAPGVEYAELRDPAAPNDAYRSCVSIRLARRCARSWPPLAIAARAPPAPGATPSTSSPPSTSACIARTTSATSATRARARTSISRACRRNINQRWRSARAAGLPAAALLDLDAPHARERLGDYDTVVQNLRLIRAPGRSV